MVNRLSMTKVSSVTKKISWLECQDFVKYVYFQVRIYINLSLLSMVLFLWSNNYFKNFIPEVGYNLRSKSCENVYLLQYRRNSFQARSYHLNFKL